jgi:hypothetical protein
METPCFSEMEVPSYHTIRFHNLKGHSINVRRHVNPSLIQIYPKPVSTESTSTLFLHLCLEFPRTLFVSWTPDSLPYSFNSISQSESQEISRLLWNPKVRFRVHSNRPLDLALDQINPVQIIISYFLVIYTNINLLCTLWSSNFCLSIHHPFPDECFSDLTQPLSWSRNFALL